MAVCRTSWHNHPLLSFFLTGMPPVPTVFTMTAELFTYGITTSLLYRNFKKNTYVSMISAMLIGRLVSILANWILFNFVLGLPFKLTAFLYSMFVIGLPGIVIQILTIPPLVTLLVHRQANVHERSRNPVTLKGWKTGMDLNQKAFFDKVATEWDSKNHTTPEK